ncbi:GNAT family N-acetyltransferase, partial [Escherichia coli]|nr:GNAT family N-acetyltransferase [Escherichia coli]
MPRALAIWRAAVDATHGFLSPEHRAEIDAIVAEQFLPQAPLWLVEDDAGLVQGFLAMDGAMIDALFVDPAAHGRGFGTALIDHA